MNFTENVKEGLKSIKENLLRAILTALIIAIGISSLVGMLTAVDGIQASVSSSFAQFGAKSFDIKGTNPNNFRRMGGRGQKQYPPIDYQEALLFIEKLPYDSKVTLSTEVTGGLEVKYEGKKTNPNSRLIGVNENYLATNSYNLEKGRNFSTFELKEGVYVAILGYEIAQKLFDKQNPIGKGVNFAGRKYMVIGVIERSGGGEGDTGSDRSVLIPIEHAYRNYSNNTNNTKLTYDITTSLNDDTDFVYAMGEATRLMRQIRKDKPGANNSFEITRSESALERLQNITSYLRIGGSVIGFITLIGAAIGLMNIMLVSVTERTKEIGVRKALGATPFRITQQFLIEAVLICIFGGISGAILGILIGNVLSTLLGSDTFVIPWFWIIIGLIISVFVGIVSGYYPAYKASKTDPIESLRFE